MFSRPAILVVLLIVGVLLMAVAVTLGNDRRRSEPRRCPRCAQRNPAVARYCAQCGAVLDD
jgi:rRNA maturation endonuclease Nob1